jgi:hypothetical protein
MASTELAAEHSLRVVDCPFGILLLALLRECSNKHKRQRFKADHRRRINPSLRIHTDFESSRTEVWVSPWAKNHALGTFSAQGRPLPTFLPLRPQLFEASGSRDDRINFLQRAARQTRISRDARVLNGRTHSIRSPQNQK